MIKSSMAKNKFVDRAIKKHGCDLGYLFLNRHGKPITRAAIQLWRKKFPPGRAIEWEEKIGDPCYETAPKFYPKKRHQNGQ